ncbi:unnamed protein product [Eruca vesicaria subsp. sativa]|uniref:Protein kinase domain-containing protein n=1 Tax=Eruca vesicaria subsp. sativa TaxID=29727 RepID=A0ABC8IRW8_ERUVS|nr:unnamed protein product [Eruca vesicaria subsp. sativa]
METGGKRREIELVVGGGEDEDEERRRSRRRHVFEEEESKIAIMIKLFHGSASQVFSGIEEAYEDMDVLDRFCVSGVRMEHKSEKERSYKTLFEAQQEEGLLALGNLKSFSFRELHVATDGFSSKHILGAGGFGNVYRGKLGDGTMVAVKRLKDVNGTSGNSQFRTELEMIVSI